MFGAAVATEAKGALALAGSGTDNVTLRHGRAKLSLPTCTDTALAPRIFEPVVDNFLHYAAHPGSTEVSWTELGPFRFAAVPAEPVASVGLAWREKLGATAIAGLVDAYVGYVETAEHVQNEVGEAKRSYFGPTLADDSIMRPLPTYFFDPCGAGTPWTKKAVMRAPASAGRGRPRGGCPAGPAWGGATGRLRHRRAPAAAGRSSRALVSWLVAGGDRR
jgi:hypothetical protein